MTEQECLAADPVDPIGLAKQIVFLAKLVKLATRKWWLESLN